MEHTKKMVLVDPRVIENLHSSQHQLSNLVEKTLSKLDDEMQAVLNHTDIPEERKVELYNQILQCYLTYKSKIEPPIVQVLQSKPKPSEELLEQTNDKNESLIDEIIASAPQKLKKRAHLLLK